MVFMTPKVADRYAGVMDIAMTDPYPVPNEPITMVQDYVSALNGYFRYKKPVWLVPQAFGGNEWWSREPDPREARAMTYLGLIHNASGIQYFIRKGLNGSPKSQATWGECGAVAQEIMELLPSLVYGQPAPPALVSRPEIRARTINRNGVFTILVVNVSNVPLEFDIQLEGIDLEIEADVLFEGRKVLMESGRLSDIIDAYGTRVYRVNSEAKPDWMKDYKRGNLVVDPGFEHSVSPAVPSACYATPGSDRGSTFFLDGRTHKQGDHSLRLITPGKGKGAKLQFFGLELDPDASYTCSVWAKKSRSTSLPSNFTLSLGKENQSQFVLSDDWCEYSFSSAGTTVKPSLHRWSMPGLELNDAGTAWFDLLQVVPDMEMTQRAKGKVPGGDPGTDPTVGMEVEIKSYHPDAMITYTLDGSQPTLQSESYSGPFVLKESAVVRAAAFQDQQLVGTIQKEYMVHKGLGAKITYDITYEKYDAGGKQGLVNGIMASEYYNDGKWQGFHGEDASLVIDLGEAEPLSGIRLRFLQDVSVWIFLPVDISVSLSKDGSSFDTPIVVSHDIPLEKRGAFIHGFEFEIPRAEARYIKIEARNIKSCPAWHNGAGQPSWVFIDEVLVD